jgi:hypothetical protein
MIKAGEEIIICKRARKNRRSGWGNRLGISRVMRQQRRNAQETD